ncbi:hypothetical protein RHSIM_Rhsim06G0180100 [Rhododendron simsii]|uniref:Uncharacterized protein n=1 Tax=Rhododendron simsii TaxID=118357 RepID=A0A834GSI1_RHOSS|nr:hypothetical protein RHSIM_Rhsim06G0180100 [Rhododendron simsii]
MSSSKRLLSEVYKTHNLLLVLALFLDGDGSEEEQRENEVIPSSDESRSVGDDHHLVLSRVWIGLISQWILVSLVRDGYLLRVTMKDGLARAQKACCPPNRTVVCSSHKFAYYDVEVGGKGDRDTCNVFRCATYVKARKQLSIHEAPNILTIVLKRFQFSAVSCYCSKKTIKPKVQDILVGPKCKSPKSMMKVSRGLLCSEMEKKGQITDESRHNGFRCAAYARKLLGKHEAPNILTIVLKSFQRMNNSSRTKLRLSKKLRHLNPKPVHDLAFLYVRRPCMYNVVRTVHTFTSGKTSSVQRKDLVVETYSLYYNNYEVAIHDLYYSPIKIPYEIAEALWLSCEKPVKRHPLYTDSCIAKPSPPPPSISSGEKRPYSYFLFGANLSASDVADHCKLDEIVMMTLRLPADKSEVNISFSDFHSKLEYGFELYWLSFLCEQCQGPHEYCSIESLNPSYVTCYKNCYGFSDSFP